MTSAGSLPPGNLRVRAPHGYQARWLTDPSDRELVERWIRDSPDACIYHSAAYIEFARAQNGRADLLWLVRDGNPVVGLPLHPGGRRRITSGYSGLLFPLGGGERALRAGVAAIADLLEANPRIGFHVLQSAQAHAYDHPGRMTALARHLDGKGLSGPLLYSRVLSLPAFTEAMETPDVSGDSLVGVGFEPYDPKLRNQIRRAVGNSLRVVCRLPADEDDIRAAYGDFVPLHRVSWQRTGMQPHDDRYWWDLSHAVIRGGGTDLIVYVYDRSHTAVAAVVCHIREGHALYWAGCSSEAGLRENANPLCLHAAIQASRQLGVHSFELGRFHARERSQKERAVTHYKSQFGGELLRIVGFERGNALAAALRRRAVNAAGW